MLSGARLAQDPASPWCRHPAWLQTGLRQVMGIAPAWGRELRDHQSRKETRLSEA